jgi:hypothetical protein
LSTAGEKSVKPTQDSASLLDVTTGGRAGNSALEDGRDLGSGYVR